MVHGILSNNGIPSTTTMSKYIPDGAREALRLRFSRKETTTMGGKCAACQGVQNLE